MKSLWQLIAKLESAFSGEGNVRVHGLHGELKNIILICLAQDLWKKRMRNVIVIYKDLQTLQSGLRNFLGFRESLYFVAPLMLPETDYWGKERFASSQQLRIERLRALSGISSQSGQILFTTPQGLLQKTFRMLDYIEHGLKVVVGDEIDMDLLVEKLLDLSYFVADRVEEPGQISRRGGILDVFPLGRLDPVRIEWLGDEVASIRTFDIYTQLSGEEITSQIIGPAEEFVSVKKERGFAVQRLFEYLMEQGVGREDREGLLEAFRSHFVFPGIHLFSPLIREESEPGLSFLKREDIFIFMDSIESLSSGFEDFIGGINKRYRDDVEACRPSFPPESHYAEFADFLALATELKLVEFDQPAYSSNVIDLMFERSFTESLLLIHAKKKISERFPKWIELWCDKVAEGYQIIILSPSALVLERIGSLLTNRNIMYKNLESFVDLRGGPGAPGIYLTAGYFDGCVDVAEDKMLLISSDEVLASKSLSSSSDSKKLKNLIQSFVDLTPGDFVVHLDHGIAKFLGIETMESLGVQNDFLGLEFAGKDKLYLPIDRLNLLQKYQATDKKSTPVVDRLKGVSWGKRKSGARTAAKEIAGGLLKAKAMRKIAPGVSFSGPGELYYEFEAGFLFEETPDQLKAILEVNQDLTLPCPMDRLVCGDVGFGKTEIALRAAMRVVVDGFQVVVVVPTTILCFQHFRTFEERFSCFGVRVAFVSRYVSRKQINATLEEFKKGRIDILIGTHRVLSKDVKAHNLGMLVIDEEQRFGVEQKEVIKSLGEGCDLLTLTATPIPRTLHMAMLGLKDVSLLMTPPKRRLPVKTFVSPFEELLIRDAVQLEVARSGQVFFIHNRVEDIEQMAGYLMRLLPGVSVGVAHGQLSALQMEKIMMTFMQGDITILCCTTIIESGIDLPNVNTMIINRSDRFGLAQIYQIKGRVGRAEKQAYCYLLYDEKRPLSKESRKRLDILASHQELGAGFQIANYDLELRGAGSLLGAEQSGHIEGIGFELFTKMLASAIDEIDGTDFRDAVDTEIKIPLSACIPEDYVGDDVERMRLYRRLFLCDSQESIEELKCEVEDRFGPAPGDFERIFKVAQLKLVLRPLRAVWLRRGPLGFFEVLLGDLDNEEKSLLSGYILAHSSEFTLVPGGKVMINYATCHSTNEDEQDKMLVALLTLIRPLSFTLQRKIP